MAREVETFVLAEKALQNVVNQIRDEQWEVPAEGIYSYAAEPQTLRQLINYHVFDDLCVPDTLAGASAKAVTEKYQGDVLGADPKTAFASAMDAAVSAVQALKGDAFDTSVNLSYGDFPVREYLVHITVFRGFRSYTIGHFLKLDTAMDAALVDGLWEEVVPSLDQWRAMGVFPPAVDAPAGADRQTQLLAMTGFLQK